MWIASFGLAVVPDVARMNAGSLDSIDSHDPEAPSAPARKASQAMSRSGCSSAGSLPLWSTTTCSTPPPTEPSASSTSGLSGTSWPRRKVTSAVKTTREPLAEIRSASACAPKPANTTEWIAPIRMHANIRITASGHVGIDSVTRSPLATPSARRAAAARLTSASRSA